jgi:hypothetical protein
LDPIDEIFAFAQGFEMVPIANREICSRVGIVFTCLIIYKFKSTKLRKAFTNIN